MGVKDDFKTGSLLSQAVLAGRVLTHTGHLRDMFNGHAFPALANGVRTRIRTVPDAEYTTLKIMIAAGADRDPPGKAGLAHMLEHMIFVQDEATMHALNMELKGRGGSLQGYTNPGWTLYELRVLNNPENLDFAAGLALCAIFGAQLDPAQVAREKPVILDEIQALTEKRAADPAATALQLAYGRSLDEKNRVPGNPASIAAITPDDLAAFHAAYYTGPNVTVEYTGPYTPMAALMMIQKYMGGLSAAPPPAMDALAVPEVVAPGGAEAFSDNPAESQAEYALAIPFLHGKDMSLETAQVLAEFLHHRVAAVMRGPGDRYAYWQQVMSSGDGSGDMALTLTGRAVPEAANRAIGAFIGALQDVAAGRIDADVLAAATGEARLNRARGVRGMLAGDTMVERPEDAAARQRWRDAALAAVDAPALVAGARAALAHGAQGLAVNGRTEGVLRLADVRALLPAGATGPALAGPVPADRNIA